MVKKRGRPPKEGIESKILKLLSKNRPLSINEMSQKLNSGWHTTDSRLNNLKKMGKIIEIKHKKIRLFLLK